MPTGAELARAAGRPDDSTGQFRRYARQWAAALTPASTVTSANSADSAADGAGG